MEVIITLIKCKFTYMFDVLVISTTYKWTVVVFNENIQPTATWQKLVIVKLFVQ